MGHVFHGIKDNLVNCLLVGLAVSRIVGLSLLLGLKKLFLRKLGLWSGGFLEVVIGVFGQIDLAKIKLGRSGDDVSYAYRNGIKLETLQKRSKNSRVSRRSYLAQNSLLRTYSK